MTSSLRIVVTGVIAQFPLGGMTWHYLQYLLGLARLGHDVYYFEDTAACPYDPARGSVDDDYTSGVLYLAEVMSRFGLRDRWAYRRGSEGERWCGMSDATRKAVIRSADLLLNVSGMLAQPQRYRAIPRLVFIDTDPVFNQIKLAIGVEAFSEQVRAHDVHFSFGELPESVPSGGYFWRATRQPVVMSEWHSLGPRREAFTTIMNWTASKHPPVYAGKTFGQKDVEFIRYLDLPERVAPTTLEIALNPGKRRRAPLELLKARGWHIVDPETVCLDLDSYRNYIESSKAEWSVAKGGYVLGRAGWFSERSACYLAAGRPVVVQDTGLAAVLPVGEGLMTFATLDEAVAAVREVEAHYDRHTRAARAIADAYFDSDQVLTRLLEQSQSPPSARTHPRAAELASLRSA